MGRRLRGANMRREIVVLHDVIDIRNEQYYSVAIIDKRMAKYFVPAEEESEVEE